MITASQELMSSEKLTTFIEVSPRKKGDPPSASGEEKIINNSNETVLCVVGAHGTVKNGMVVNIKKVLEKAIVTET